MGDALVGEERYVFNGSDRRTDGMAKSGIDCPGRYLEWVDGISGWNQIMAFKHILSRCLGKHSQIEFETAKLAMLFDIGEAEEEAKVRPTTLRRTVILVII